MWWSRGEPFRDVRMPGANRALTIPYVRYALIWLAIRVYGFPSGWRDAAWHRR